MRLRFSLLYDRPLSLRDLGLLTVASPQPVERRRPRLGRLADSAGRKCSLTAIHERKMIMTLQAGDKLMSLTDVSEMLGIPVTPCIAGGTRATVRSAIGWAVTCGTVGRPLRFGWSSRPTSASKPGARSVPSGPRSIGPGAGQSGLEEVFEHLGRSGRALLATHVAVGRRVRL